jgi:hypothetical protein
MREVQGRHRGLPAIVADARLASDWRDDVDLALRAIASADHMAFQISAARTAAKNF